MPKTNRLNDVFMELVLLSIICIELTFNENLVSHVIFFAFKKIQLHNQISYDFSMNIENFNNVLKIVQKNRKCTCWY